MSVRKALVRVPGERVAEAAGALRALSTGKLRYVDRAALAAATSLREAVRAFGWDVFAGEDAMHLACSLSGQAGEEDRLFEALAPYVDSGGLVEVAYEHGEQHALWLFRTGKVKRFEGTVTYPGAESWQGT